MEKTTLCLDRIKHPKRSAEEVVLGGSVRLLSVGSGVGRGGSLRSPPLR